MPMNRKPVIFGVLAFLLLQMAWPQFSRQDERIQILKESIDILTTVSRKAEGARLERIRQDAENLKVKAERDLASSNLDGALLILNQAKALRGRLNDVLNLMKRISQHIQRAESRLNNIQERLKTSDCHYISAS